MRKWIKYNEGYDNCYLKEYRSLHLQNYLKDEHLTQDDIIKIIENISLIDPDYLDSSWSGLYYGLTPLRYLKYENEFDPDSDKIIKYIQLRIEMFRSIEDQDDIKSDTELSPISISTDKKNSKKKKFRPKTTISRFINRISTPKAKKEDSTSYDSSFERRRTAPILTSFPIPDSVTQHTQTEGDDVSDDDNSSSRSSPISEMDAIDKDFISIAHAHAQSVPAPPSLPSTNKNDIPSPKSVHIEPPSYDGEKHARLNRSRKKRRSYERRMILKQEVVQKEETKITKIQSPPPPPIDVPSAPRPRVGSKSGSELMRYQKMKEIPEDGVSDEVSENERVSPDAEVTPDPYLKIEDPDRLEMTKLLGKKMRRMRHRKSGSLPSTPERRRSSRIKMDKLKAVLNVDRLSEDINRVGIKARKNDLRIDDLEKKLEDAQRKIVEMKRKLEEQEEKEREREMEMDTRMMDNELRECNIELMVDNGIENNWKKWSYLEIIRWIISLEGGRYDKYKHVLFKKMKLRNMCGEYLIKMEKSDLETFFGINDFGDICDLWQHIKRLINDGDNKHKQLIMWNPLQLQDSTVSVASTSIFAEHEVDSILDDIMTAEQESEREKDH